MGSLWTDKSAILRDLSFAQGRWVPGGIESAVAGAKPPAHNIEEETEEEYFRRWTMLESGGTGDFSAGPDLFRIKKMLELMQYEEGPNEEILSGPVEIRKLNPVASQFVPKIKQIAKENIDPNPRKPRKARNVAIASIMALTNEPLKLIKPGEFIKPSKEDEEMKEKRQDSVNKVTNWLQSQDITSMFKKKPVNSFIEKQSLKNVERLSKSPASELSVKSLNGYTPTVWAEEYYRKAVDRSHVRDLVRDDVWGRAERIMKEIDTKKEELRKKEVAAELEAEIARQCEALEAVKISEDTDTAADSPDPVLNAEPKGIGHILLPLSRHSLFPVAACAVCRALDEHPLGRHRALPEDTAGQDRALPKDTDGQDRALPKDTDGQDRALPEDTDGQDRALPKDTDGQDRALPKDTDGQDRALPEDTDGQDRALPKDTDGQDRALPKDTDGQDRALPKDTGRPWNSHSSSGICDQLGLDAIC